jgi:hypothetical protein
MSNYSMGFVHHYFRNPPPFRKGSGDADDMLPYGIHRHYQIVYNLKFRIMCGVIQNFAEKFIISIAGSQ